MLEGLLQALHAVAVGFVVVRLELVRNFWLWLGDLLLHWLSWFGYFRDHTWLFRLLFFPLSSFSVGSVFAQISFLHSVEISLHHSLSSAGDICQVKNEVQVLSLDLPEVMAIELRIVDLHLQVDVELQPEMAVYSLPFDTLVGLSLVICVNFAQEVVKSALDHLIEG